MAKTYGYGFPRLGKQREFKTLIEGYWAGKLTEEELRAGIAKLNDKREETYKKYVDAFPKGEMTFYDNLFDTALIFGIYSAESLDEYFNLCRGKNALEMTKWFNTNYHYLVPDFEGKEVEFKLGWNKHEGIKKNAYLIGPFTLLKLSKNLPEGKFTELLKKLAAKYLEYFKFNGFESVHLDEPAFVMELTDGEVEAIKEAYKSFESVDTKINVFTYYDGILFKRCYN